MQLEMIQNANKDLSLSYSNPPPSTWCKHPLILRFGGDFWFHFISTWYVNAATIFEVKKTPSKDLCILEYSCGGAAHLGKITLRCEQFWFHSHFSTWFLLNCCIEDYFIPLYMLAFMIFEICSRMQLAKSTILQNVIKWINWKHDAFDSYHQ